MSKIAAVEESLLYPGIRIDYETWALKLYLDLVEEQVAVARDQYKIRAKQSLKRRKGNYTAAQLKSEEYRINQVTKNIIPLYFLNSALIPIWSHFESSVEILANFVYENDETELKIRDVKANDIILQASKYFKVTLDIELPWSETDKSKLLTLKELRNAIAHHNGRITHRGDDYYDRMSKLIDNTDGVELMELDIYIVITPRYLHESAELVTRVLSKLNKLISDKHGGLLEAQFPEIYRST